MWSVQAKSDQEGNAMCFRLRLCAQCDKTRAGCGLLYNEDIARIASYRRFMALCNLLGLEPFQCDVDTVFRNSSIKITHYIRHIPGSREYAGYNAWGWVYKVQHAMYGLHQSGRE